MSPSRSGTRNLVDISLVGRYPACVAIYAEDAREIVRITGAGQVVVNPAFKIDEAARAFWEAVEKLARKR